MPSLQLRRCYLPGSASNVSQKELPCYPGNELHIAAPTPVIRFLLQVLYKQMYRVANIYLLAVSIVQIATGLSPAGRYSTLIPLVCSVSLSVLREAIEEYHRHAVDRKVNRRLTRVLRDGAFVDIRWRDLKVGDIVRVEQHEQFPADLAILSTAREEGLCYMDTAILDGEMNLKMRQAIGPVTQQWQTAPQLQGARGYIDFEAPSPSYYRMRGSYIPLTSTQRPVPLSQWYQVRLRSPFIESSMAVAVCSAAGSASIGSHGHHAEQPRSLRDRGRSILSCSRHSLT